MEPGITCETHKGSPAGSIGAWTTPPNSLFFPEYHASTARPFFETFASASPSVDINVPSRISYAHPTALASSSAS